MAKASYSKGKLYLKHFEFYTFEWPKLFCIETLVDPFMLMPVCHKQADERRCFGSLLQLFPL